MCQAKKSVKVAVAWINLNIYGPIFIKLLSKGIRVEIVLNDDNKNNNNHTIEKINELENKGALIKFIKMPTPYQFMHHKFCLIDNKMALIGSYNWTKNAAKNFENLMCIDNYIIVEKLKNEFNLLKNISNEEIYKLKNFDKCCECKDKIINIMVLTLDINKYHETKSSVYSMCDCDVKNRVTDYLGGQFYLTLNSIFEKYSDDDAFYNQERIEELNDLRDYEVGKLIENSFRNALDITVHAIGIYEYKPISRDGDGEWLTRIVWKDRFAAHYIEDVYDDF